MKRVKLCSNPYGEKDIIAGNYTFDEGLNVLIGKNGSGKSTVIRLLEDYLRKRKTTFDAYDNLRNGGNNALQAAVWHGNFDAVFRRAFHSEGEQIYTNVGDFIGRLGKIIKTIPEGKEFWVLGDAMDSGLSVNNIKEVKDVFNFILKDAQKRNVKLFVVLSANTFGLARNARCVDVTTGKVHRFNSYEEFEQHIMR